MQFNEDIARSLRRRGIDSQADPTLIREQLRELDRQARVRAEEELARLREQLLAHGIDVQDLSELTADSQVLRRATPLLVEAFPRMPGARRTIFRVFEAGGRSPRELLQLLRSLLPAIEEERRRGEAEPTVNMGVEIGSALEQAQDLAPVFDEMLAVLRDRRYGRARVLFVDAPLKVRRRRAEAVAMLLDVLDDPDLTAQALGALARAREVEALPRIRAYADSPIPLIRNEARKAIRKLERLAGAAPASPAVPRSGRGPKRRRAGMAETSRNFDLDHFQRVLRHLPTVIEGVQAAEIEQVLMTVEDMEPDDEQTFTLAASWQGVPEQVTLSVFMDDVDAPDVTFAARLEIIHLIDAALS